MPVICRSRESVGAINFYVYSDGVYAPPWQTSGINYFGLSTVTGIDTMGQMTSAANLSVAQAYAIDTKLDDGLPAERFRHSTIRKWRCKYELGRCCRHRADGSHIVDL